MTESLIIKHVNQSYGPVLARTILSLRARAKRGDRLALLMLSDLMLAIG